jgi:CHASE2 domain-containing sensor protein
MKRTLLSLRLIGPCLIVAAIAQFEVCRTPPGAYSQRNLFLWMAGWAICSLTLAWFERRPFFVYFGSVALSAPVISYSILGYGALEMGGWLHAFAAGAWIIPFHFVFRGIRARKAGTVSAGPDGND